MIVPFWQKLMALAPLALTSWGCATTPPDQIAMIETQNAAVTEVVLRTLRQAMGTQSVTLGARESGYDSVVTVLPPPLGPNETRSLSVPEMFDVKKRNNICYLVRRSTGVSYALTGVACVVPPPLPGSTGR